MPMNTTTMAVRVRRPFPTPTSAAPGSPEKIAVLAARVENRQRLWHPADCDLPTKQKDKRNIYFLPAYYQRVIAEAISSIARNEMDVSRGILHASCESDDF